MELKQVDIPFFLKGEWTRKKLIYHDFKSKSLITTFKSFVNKTHTYTYPFSKNQNKYWKMQNNNVDDHLTSIYIDKPHPSCAPEERKEEKIYHLTFK